MPSPDHPKVTALISTYNRPQYLAESIQSIMIQTMDDWELIVLNDGGVDVAGVVEKFADPRIIYVPDSVNKGAAIRFNQGLQLARGDYVCYLGDDDLFYPNHFECLSKALDENPEAGLAYSDLYAASSVSDNKTGERFTLDKQMLVSRDFNREFMFHFNHVLHVSLMHRREAALRVGCFDENVKVLIEWSLNRRLAFIYDFVHVEEATGEYHMAVFKSDRISVRERRNQESYKHNLRRIRCNFPAEPWGKIDRVDMLYLVDRWGKKLNNHLKDIIDNFDHPMRIKLIGNGAGLTAKEAKNSLKELAELKNIDIIHYPQRLDPVIAFRKAAKESDAEFLFLVTPNLQAVAAPRRIFVGLDVLKTKEDLHSIRWNVPGEEKEKTVFECLVYRDYFLKHTRPSATKKGKAMMIPTVTMATPKGFKFDAMYTTYSNLVKEKDYKAAKSLMTDIMAERKGFPHVQYLIRDLEELAYNLGDFEEFERELFGLLERGYLPDNYIRLCKLRHHQGRYKEAIEAGWKAMACLDLDIESFDNQCFPLRLPIELGCFRLFMDMGDCYLKLRDEVQAARYYHMASKVNGENHRPFLGFAKAYLAAGELGRAEGALSHMPGKKGQSDPETHRLLAQVCRQRKNLQLAFECLLKAFEHGPADEENLEPLYFTGAGIGRFREMVMPIREFLGHRPDHSVGWGRLSSIYFNLGEKFLATEAAEKCLALDPKNQVAKSIMSRINSGREMPKPAHAVVESGANGLTIDTSNALANLLNTDSILMQ
ncbi:MAG: glycosyltransferase [Deltaproteobacteria bacterium]|jgi:glycosyltransferase involved in cell wall biosynthesis/tetratricopeptide (TPR) repeat protein|nr:glycosyltransferase [Deltaproteobacteria bacterium]